MTIKKNQLVLLSLTVFVVVLFFGLNSISSQDEWICQGGKWIASGSPAEETKPIFDCKKNVDKGIVYDVYCEQDTDCSCGGHTTKRSCFVGNKRYVDPAIKCDKLCASNLKMQCVRNQCKQVK
jgi:hypothetical protein